MPNIFWETMLEEIKNRVQESCNIYLQMLLFVRGGPRVL